MRSLKYITLGFAVAVSLVMVAYAQEKSCEFAGKSYPHGHQAWAVNGSPSCYVCEDGVWKSSLSTERYCKGKY